MTPYSDDTLEQRESLYRSIEQVIDIPTREVLYIQFIGKYYPEAFAAINGNFLKLLKQKALMEALREN